MLLYGHMNNVQRIKATEARNNFFHLLKKSYLEKQTFLIEKGDIPMVYIVPTSEDIFKRDSTFQEVKKQLKILKKIEKIHQSMKVTSNSVSLLRKMRRHG